MSHLVPEVGLEPRSLTSARVRRMTLRHTAAIRYVPAPRSEHLECDDGLVTLDRFADRLDPATYENDDGLVGVFESDPGEEDSLWISERLFHRLTAVAAGYEMHTLPMLGGSDPIRLNGQRCQSLLDELAFVADRLDDPIASSTAQSIQDYIAVRVQRLQWDGAVTFEGE